MKNESSHERHEHPDVDPSSDPRTTAYVLDELSAAERAQLEQELASRPELADEVRSIAAFTERLRSAFESSSEPGLDADRRAEILRATQAPLPRPRLRPRPSLVRRIAVAAGVIALTGGAGVLALRKLEPNEQTAASRGRSTEPAIAFESSLQTKTSARGGEGLNPLGSLAPEGTSGSQPASPPAERVDRQLGFYEGRTVGDPTAPSASSRPASPSVDAAGYRGGEKTSDAVELLKGIQALGYADASQPNPPFARQNNPVQVYPLRPAVDRGAPGTETYDAIAETGFHDPLREPLSTFSIDVDTASYANVRRFLSNRQLPPPDAVRIEELVNYFAYAYPEPRGETPFSVTVDGASCPWNPEHRLVRIGLKGRSVDFGAPRVKNLVFLVDVSGSMDEPDKLPLVQRSLRLLVNELSGEDRVALVVYAGSSGLVLPATPIQERTRILDAIDNLKAGGSTNGGSGIQLAYATALEHFAQNGVNRVILATDGDFNVGVTDRNELLRLIEEKAKSGVFLSVLGFGTGNLKDATMEQLADHGNGNYAYVDSLAEARKVLVREMGATLETIAKDVKIQVEFNPARVSAWRLVGYENRLLAARDFNDDKKDAGEIGAGHTVTALYEITPTGLVTAGVDPLRYQAVAATPAASETGSRELLTVKLRYKEPKADTSQLLSQPFTDGDLAFAQAGEDFRFAAAVAAFGLCLRGSDQRGSATFADVYRWAETSVGGDSHGDRREFLRLVDVAAGLFGR